MKLRRTLLPKNIEIFVNYYDRNHAQRWGVMVEDHKNYVVVEDIFGERTKVMREKIIRTQEKKHISILDKMKNKTKSEN